MCPAISAGFDSAAKISEQLSASNISERASVDYFGSVLPTEILVKIFDFLDNDHDSLEALHFTSKRMAIRVKPFLMAKRKKILDAFVDFLNLNIIEEDALLDEMLTGSSSRVGSVHFVDNCAFLLLKSEKCLKSVLRINEYFSLRAHNLPMRLRSFVLLGVGGSINDEDQLSREKRALNLLTTAQRHCYKFSNFYNLFTPLRLQYVHSLNKNIRTKIEQALAYLIFKNFMYKFPVLSRFTNVIWPKKMPKKDKLQLAKEYVRKNKETAKFSKPRGIGRKCALHIHDGVDNSCTTKPVRVRKSEYFCVRKARPYNYADDFDYADEYWHEHIDGYDDPYQCHCRRHHRMLCHDLYIYDAFHFA